jgi:hypothetical protein
MKFGECKAGDRVRHKLHDELAKITEANKDFVTVIFDRKTRGVPPIVGVYDRKWFKENPDLLEPVT